MMKNRKYWYWLFLVYICVNSTFGQNSSHTFSIGPDNTRLEFRSKHFGVINVSGTFKSFSGQITITDDIITSGKISLNANSINTENSARDKSLRDKEFLDSHGYPIITVSFDKNDQATLISSLITIKERSVSIPVPYEISPTIKGTKSIKAHCNISRELFHLNFGSMDDLISDKIDVNVFVTLKNK